MGCSKFGIRGIRRNWSRRAVHHQSMPAFERHLEDQWPAVGRQLAKLYCSKVLGFKSCQL